MIGGFGKPNMGQVIEPGKDANMKPQSVTVLSTVAVQSGRSQIVLSVLKVRL